MAVQAQHPSNILLLNRPVPEKIDCSLPPQSGGLGFLNHQPHMFYNNGGVGDGNSSRKRGRDALAGESPMTLAVGNPGNPFVPTEFVDFSQAYRGNPLNISTGLRLSSDHLHRQQSFIASQSSLLNDLGSTVKQQGEELDQFLQAQGEQLRRAIAERRQKHMRALMDSAAELLNRRLREKETEIEKVTCRNTELEARAAQLSVEAQLWQAKARAQEAIAASLQAQLQQAVVFCGGKDDGAGGGVEGQADDEESAYVDPERMTSSSAAAVAASGRVGVPMCRSCQVAVARVVVLPCRHLCLCSTCDSSAQTCPVCFHARNSSIEVVLC